MGFTASTFSGVTYQIPNSIGQTNWSGPNGVDGLLIALAKYSISIQGGTYSLVADLNLGIVAGLVSPYYKSNSASIATTGQVRLSLSDTIDFGVANNALGCNSSNQPTWNGSPIATSVKSFGAKGDATTDDTLAIQAALNAGGVIFFPPGRYKVTSTLLFKFCSTSLIGSGPDNSYSGPATEIFWAGSTSSTMLKCNGSLAFFGIYITRILFNGNSTNGVTLLDSTWFAQSCRVENCVFSINGNNTRGIYMLGGSGSAPYYSEYVHNDFYGSCNGSTITGAVGIYLDRTLVGGVWSGPNANRFHGGRFAAVDVGIWIRAGADNIIDGFDGESNIVDHIRLGDPTADATGTVSSSTKQVITCSGTPFTSAAAVATGARIVGAVTQYGEVQSNTTSAVTLLSGLNTLPLAGDTVSLWYECGNRNIIRSARGEGAAGCNGIRIYPGSYGNFVDGTSFQSLGGGTTVNMAILSSSDRINAENWKDPVPYSFSMGSVAASLTSVQLAPNGGFRSIFFLGGWQVIGMMVMLDGNITAGTLSIWACDNGGKITTPANVILDANSDQSNGGSNIAILFPPNALASAGRSRCFDVQITTTGSFLPTTLNMQVIALVQNVG